MLKGARPVGAGRAGGWKLTPLTRAVIGPVLRGARPVGAGRAGRLKLTPLTRVVIGPVPRLLAKVVDIVAGETVVVPSNTVVLLRTIAAYAAGLPLRRKLIWLIRATDPQTA